MTPQVALLSILNPLLLSCSQPLALADFLSFLHHYFTHSVTIAWRKLHSFSASHVFPHSEALKTPGRTGSKLETTCSSPVDTSLVAYSWNNIAH